MLIWQPPKAARSVLADIPAVPYATKTAVALPSHW